MMTCVPVAAARVGACDHFSRALILPTCAGPPIFGAYYYSYEMVTIRAKISV